MKVEKIKEELDSLKVELQSVKSMSECNVMALYNADSKADIIEIIEEEITVMQNDLEQAIAESRCSLDRLDPAFSSWEQVNSMFV